MVAYIQTSLIIIWLVASCVGGASENVQVSRRVVGEGEVHGTVHVGWEAGVCVCCVCVVFSLLASPTL